MIFDGLYDEKKYRYPAFNGRYAFAFNQVVDDKPYKANQNNDITLKILTPNSDERADEATMRILSGQSSCVLVVLPDDRTFLDEIRSALQIEKFIRFDATNTVTQFESIKEAKKVEMRERNGAAKLFLSESLKNAEIYVNGDKIQSGAKEIASKINEALGKLVSTVYHKLSYIDTAMSESDIHTLFKNNGQQLTLVGTNITKNELALYDVNDYIALNTQRHMKTSMKSILERFLKAPYGFVEADVQWLVAKLFKNGEIAMFVNNDAVTLLSKTSEEIIRYLTRKEFNEKLMTEKRVKANEKQKKSVRTVMKELFNVTSASDDDDAIMRSFLGYASNLKNDLEKLDIHYATQTAYPGKQLIASGKKLMADVLQMKYSNEFFAGIDRKKDDFLDFAEDYEPVKKFFAGEQKGIFDKALKLMKIYDDSKTFIVNSEIESVVADIKSILKKSVPYSEIFKLPDLLDKFINLYSGLLNEMQKPLDTAIQEARQRVFEELQDKKCHDKLADKYVNLFREISDKAMSCNNVANGLTTDSEQNKIGEYLVEAYKDAQEIGTLQTIEKKDYKEFVEYLNNIESGTGQIDLFSTEWLNDTLPKMLQLAKQAEIMSNKYAVVCTNPPYMNKLEGQLKKFVVDNYKAYCGDLFSVFIYRNFDYCKINGYSAFMTPFVWMFIKTYEALRKYIIDTKSITTLVQMEYSAFEEATVPICSFVLKNGKATGKSLCFRLSEFKGGMEVQKQKVLEALARKNCGYFYESVQSNFSKIPGSPIAYWVSKGIMDSFVYGELLGNIAEIVTGMSTGDNNSYLRFWHEISEKNISIYSDKMEEIDLVKTPWIPYNKGGEARKWYGNNDYVVKWKESEKFHRPRPTFSHLYLKKGITWSFVTSGMYSARYYPNGFLWDVAGSPCVITNEKLMYYVLGFLSTKIANQILKIINPTINCQVVDMQNTPILINEEKMDDVQLISQHSVDVSKEDWDAFETSWDFKKHPLLCYSSDKVSIAFEIWSKECDERFNQLKANEEELNRIFIEIYGLQDELTPEVEDKDVTVRQADLQRDIKSLISYAVGCM